MDAKFDEFGKWREEVNRSVVRSVMEDNPNVADKVIDAHWKLASQGMKSEVAMKEARRLYGLLP